MFTSTTSVVLFICLSRTKRINTDIYVFLNLSDVISRLRNFAMK